MHEKDHGGYTRVLFRCKPLRYALAPRFKCGGLRVYVHHYKTTLILGQLPCLVAENGFGSLVGKGNARY